MRFSEACLRSAAAKKHPNTAPKQGAFEALHQKLSATGRGGDRFAALPHEWRCVIMIFVLIITISVDLHWPYIFGCIGPVAECGNLRSAFLSGSGSLATREKRRSCRWRD